MNATKDSTGEPTSPNPIQSAVEFVPKHWTIQKSHMFLGLDYPEFVAHIFKDIVKTTIEINYVKINK